MKLVVLCFLLSLSLLEARRVTEQKRFQLRHSREKIKDWVPTDVAKGAENFLVQYVLPDWGVSVNSECQAGLNNMKEGMKSVVAALKQANPCTSSSTDVSPECIKHIVGLAQNAFGPDFSGLTTSLSQCIPPEIPARMRPPLNAFFNFLNTDLMKQLISGASAAATGGVAGTIAQSAPIKERFLGTVGYIIGGKLAYNIYFQNSENAGWYFMEAILRFVCLYKHGESGAFCDARPLAVPTTGSVPQVGNQLLNQQQFVEGVERFFTGTLVPYWGMTSTVEACRQGVTSIQAQTQTFLTGIRPALLTFQSGCSELLRMNLAAIDGGTIFRAGTRCFRTASTFYGQFFNQALNAFGSRFSRLIDSAKSCLPEPIRTNAKCLNVYRSKEGAKYFATEALLTQVLQSANAVANGVVPWSVISRLVGTVGLILPTKFAYHAILSQGNAAAQQEHARVAGALLSEVILRFSCVYEGVAAWGGQCGAAMAITTTPAACR